MKALPKSKVAAVQTSPVFLDIEATVDKACSLIAEAACNGAKLVAFPEVFLAGYPYWNWLMTPVEGGRWFERLVKSAIEIPGPEIARIAAAAREYACTVVIGANESSWRSLGTVYNTNVVISSTGEILGRHRKLVPTWAEKLSWAGGDGSTLKVYDTEVGPLGTLACGENTNTLARFALLSQGELVHVANYISLPVAPDNYNMAEAIRIRAAAHSFEGKLFTIVACSTISDEIIEQMSEAHPEARKLLERRNGAFSGVIGPDGNVVGDPLIDEEGIVYAEIDLNDCIQPKQMHNIIGSYNRFDIFDLRVNRTPRAATAFFNDLPEPEAGDGPPAAACQQSDLGRDGAIA